MVKQNNTVTKRALAYILTLQSTRFDRALCAALTERGIDTYLVSPLSLSPEDARNAHYIVNRVPPSSAIRRSFSPLRKTLELLTAAEMSGVAVFPSSHAALADYSKYHGYRKMLAAGVPTPTTRRCPSRPLELSRRAIVVKPNTGGYGRQVELIRTESAWCRYCSRTSRSLRRRMVIQEFAKSVYTYDFRVTVLNGKIVDVQNRTLVHGWLGSQSRGAMANLAVFPPRAVTALALKASAAIQAGLNAADIVWSRKGPLVIENNVTPGFSSASDSELSLMASRTADLILSLSGKSPRNNV